MALPDKDRLSPKKSKGAVTPGSPEGTPRRNKPATIVNADPQVPTEPQSQIIRAGQVMTLGRYQILGELGRGGMGTVYLAEDAVLKRKVALKIPQFEPLKAEQFQARFLREAQMAAQLSHPNICQVYDVGVIDGQYVMAMEFVEGRTLSDFTKPVKLLSERQVVTLIRKVALAVEAAHQKGLIHRDLKPGNIMLPKPDPIRKVIEPKVMDFGLAKSLQPGGTELTKSGMIVGTPCYMSKEQWSVTDKQLGPECDVYSLGVILYELLTGQLPYDVHNDEPPTAWFVKLVTQPAIRLSERKPDIDAALEIIVMKAIAPEPNERFSSMLEFADALEAWQKGAPTTRVRSKRSFAEISDAPNHPLPSKGNGSSRNQPPRIPPKLLWWGGLGGAAVFFFGIVVVITSRDGTRTRIETNSNSVTVSSPSGEVSVTTNDDALIPETAKTTDGEVTEEPNAAESSKDVQPVDDAHLNSAREESTSATLRTDGWVSLLPDSNTDEWSDLGPFVLQDGVLTNHNGSGYAVSRNLFLDFELMAEWRIEAGSNGGIYYRQVDTDPRTAGTEYQIRDDEQYDESSTSNQHTGALTFVAAPSDHVAKPVGDWNVTRILCRGANVEHWLNNQKILAYNSESPDSQATTNSAWWKQPVGAMRRGHIMLQAISGVVSYRNIRVRELKEMSETKQRSSDPASAPAAAIVPFDSEQAREHQEAWARYIGQPVEIENSVGITLRLIPAAMFSMGGEESHADAEHEVRITHSYYISATEVTQSQWTSVMNTQPWKNRPNVQNGTTFPATHVSWEDAAQFCRNLSERDGRTYRLPTEAQWEFACMAGTQSAYSFGSDVAQLGNHAWYADNTRHAGNEYAHPVGEKTANHFGLFDMHGNVWEWCRDWSREYSRTSVVDPQGPPDGLTKVVRGGSWGREADACRGTRRDQFDPSGRSSYIGFRVILDLPERQ